MIKFLIWVISIGRHTRVWPKGGLTFNTNLAIKVIQEGLKKKPCHLLFLISLTNSSKKILDSVLLQAKKSTYPCSSQQSELLAYRVSSSLQGCSNTGGPQLPWLLATSSSLLSHGFSSSLSAAWRDYHDDNYQDDDNNTHDPKDVNDIVNLYHAT